MNKPNIVDRKPFLFEAEPGINYAWCSCGLSKKENGAFCDGSHKTTDFKPHFFTVEEKKKIALCMCKHTGNPPFCDGTHAGL